MSLHFEALEGDRDLQGSTETHGGSSVGAMHYLSSRPMRRYEPLNPVIRITTGILLPRVVR